MKYSFFETKQMEGFKLCARSFLFCLLCGSVTGIAMYTEAQMTISPDIVVLSSTHPETTQFVCSISSSIGINDIFKMHISRKRQYDNTFVALAEVKGTAANSATFVSDAPGDITNRGTVSGAININTPTVSSLKLSVNTNDILCTDFGQYECSVTFLDLDGNIGTHSNVKTLNIYALPGNIIMVVHKNDQTILGTESHKADVFVGENVVFTCSATIGSVMTTTVRWRRTSVTGSLDNFTPYYPLEGDYDDGNASPATQDCSYSRTATMSYTVTPFDAKRENNLAFQCYLSVVPPNGQGIYETNAPPTFYINPLPQLLMTVSPSVVALTSLTPPTITFTCSLSSSAGITDVYSLKISRRRDIDNDFIDIAEVKTTTPGTPSLATNAPADIVNRAMVFGGIDNGKPTKSTLALRINTQDIVCTDKGQYQCFLIYQDGNKNIETMSNIQHLSTYALPGNASLSTTLSGENLQGTIDAKFDVYVCYTLEFTCTADIGSDSKTKVKWRQTTLVGSEDTFIPYIPQPGSNDDGQASSSTHGCSFTRTAKMRYMVTKLDANRANNLAFQCYAMVVTGQGASETEYPPTFYINPILEDDTTNTTETTGDNPISSATRFVMQPIFVILATVIVHVTFG